MAKQDINVPDPAPAGLELSPAYQVEDATIPGTGDNKIEFMQKTKDNFDELYAIAGTGGSPYNDMGDYDASTNLFPETGGSGTDGAVRKGDCFDISVGGNLGGEDVGVGATIRAKVNDPGQTLSNWRIYF